MKVSVLTLVGIAVCLPQVCLGWGGYGGAPANPGFPVQPFPSDPQQPQTDEVPPVFLQDPPQTGFPTFPAQPVGSPNVPVSAPFDPDTPVNPGRPQRTKRPRRPRRPRKPKQGGNRCQKFAKKGNCRFYNCFRKIEPDCLAKGEFLIEDLETFCQNIQPLIKGGAFSAWGKKYIKKVRRCQTNLLANFVRNQNCDAVNSQANIALFGTETGSVDPRDCYWQNEQFCEAIGNVNDNVALVQAIFGDEDGEYDEEKIALAEHLSYLSTFCPQSAQDVFQENFVNNCPPGTIQEPATPPPPMMMMPGAGGD